MKLLTTHLRAAKVEARSQASESSSAGVLVLRVIVDEFFGGGPLKEFVDQCLIGLPLLPGQAAEPRQQPGRDRNRDQPLRTAALWPPYTPRTPQFPVG